MTEALRLARKLFYKGNCMPEVVTAFVTHRCNADCSFCFFRESLNVPVRELSANEWKKIAKSIGPFSLLILTGGEPFLRRDLAEIAGHFADFGVAHISIPTNGTRPERVGAVAEALLENTRLRSLCISVSIDAIGGEHDEIRKIDSGFSLITETIRRLKALKSKYGRRLILHTATVFSAATQHQIERTLEFIRRDFQPDTMGLTLARQPAGPEHRANLDTNLYLRLNRNLAHNSVSSRYSVIGAKLHRAKAARVVREQIFNDFISPCYAGKINAVIQADGKVPLCESRPEIMGDLREYNLDFAALWSSQAKRELVRRQQQERCRCGHECYITPNIGFNARALASALSAAG